MKPIVIYIGKGDEIKLTKEEFEKYLNEAYSAGYDAGYANAYKPYISYPWWTNTQPTINPDPPLKITWDKETTPYTWTCNGPDPDATLSHPYVTCDGANDLSNYTIKSNGKATFNCKTGELKNEKT